MKRTRLLLGLMAFWEILRFSLFFYLLEFRLPVENAASAPLVLWFGAPQLIVAVGFAAAAAFPDRYSAAIPLGILAKVVALVLGFFNILAGGLPPTGFGTGISSLLFSLAPVAIVGVDTLVVLLLLGTSHSLSRREET